MKIALASMDIIWEDKAGNKKRAMEHIQRAVKEEADLIVFPEMTLTGFSNHIHKIAEDVKELVTVDFFKEVTKRYKIAIGFGYAQATWKKAYNRFCFVAGGEVLGDYAKIHPFSFAGESNYFEAGEELVGVTYQNVNFGLFICYDLRFSEIFLKSSEVNQVLLVIANWPEERIKQWEILLKARAVETQCYVVGVNRKGEGNGLVYSESSMMIDPRGEEVKLTEDGRNHYGTINVNTVEKYQERFPVKRDRRKSLYQKYYEE